MREVRTTCAYCGVGCGIAATVTGEREVTIAGDPAHPANAGKLCSKGTYLGETVGLEGRLLHPMIGEARAGWDEALGLVAGRMAETIAEHGPDSVAFYVSGQLLTEDYYVANKLMKGFVGSANIDTNSRLCMASAVAAHNRGFGEDVVPCTYDDLDEADLILLVGSNTAWCHPVVWQRIEAARERRGTRLVVIDPRRTETADRADLHIPVAPDGDVALFNALTAEMARRGRCDRAFLDAMVDVPAGFWDGLDGDGPGIDAALFAALADLVAETPRMVTVFSQGANQSVSGTDKGNAIINLHLVTGRISRPGTGPFSITGQPNAMGGREVGGLANMLACHLGFSDAERADVAAFWASERLCAGPGLKAVDLFRAVHDGRIKFLWVMATNPAVSMPDAGFVREALARCPTVVVSDVMADTDTGRFAHVRLPALAWGEKDGTVTNSDRWISRQKALFDAPGEARADWRIVCDVARRMGWDAPFDFASVAAVFREYAAMTGLAARHGRKLDLTHMSGMSDAAFEDMAPTRWGGAHPFATGFSTPGGRARLVRVEAPRPRRAGSLPLRFNTGRYRDQWHTMTRTGLSATLSQHRREPLLEVHPDDARRFGLAEHGIAEVMTAQGVAVFRVALEPGQRRGEIFAPMHWSDVMASGGRTNRLASSATDPVSGQPGFKDTPATMRAVSPDWRGFLVTTGQPAIGNLLYWTRARITAGWLYELAGMGNPEVEALLPPGERIEALDSARRMRRIAVIAPDGTVIAALYLTRNGVLPGRAWIAAQLGLAEASAPELLAGRPRTPQEDTGPLVCLCHGVGERTILAAVAGGACSVAEVGACTAAGTNCGSCRPAIARLVALPATQDKEAA